jgi:hypothetical protein
LSFVCIVTGVVFVSLATSRRRSLRRGVQRSSRRRDGSRFAAAPFAPDHVRTSSYFERPLKPFALVLMVRALPALAIHATVELTAALEEEPLPSMQRYEAVSHPSSAKNTSRFISRAALDLLQVCYKRPNRIPDQAVTSSKPKRSPKEQATPPYNRSTLHISDTGSF